MSKTIEFVEEKIKMLNVVIESTVKIIKEFDGIAPADSYKKLVEDHLKEIGTFQQIKAELEAWEVVKQNIVEEDNIIDRDTKVIKVKCQLYPKGESNGKYEKLKKALEAEE